MQDSLISELKKLRNDRKYSYVFENFLAIMNCIYQTISKDELLSFIAYLIIEKNYVDTDFDFDSTYSEIDEEDFEDSVVSEIDFEHAKQDFVKTSIKQIEKKLQILSKE